MELDFQVHQNINTVYAYLTDMDKFTAIHPIISKIVKTGDQSYKVHETLKFGFIPFPFTYPITLQKNESNKTVSIYATVFRLVKIELHFKLAEREHLTEVRENIKFNTILPIKFLLRKVFKEQHELLFSNLNKLQ